MMPEYLEMRTIPKDMAVQRTKQVLYLCLLERC